MTTGTPAEVLGTRTIRLRYSSGRVTAHQIELLAWHIGGWAMGRCLTHGLTQPMPYDGDLKATATATARQCGYNRAIPFHQDKQLEPTPQPGAKPPTP